MKTNDGDAVMLNRIFLVHPARVNETYGQHFLFALTMAIRLFAAALAALIHAFIPCLFEKTASRMVAQIYERTHDRGPQESSDPAATNPA